MSQRQVLESQTVVSAGEDDQEPNNADDPSDYCFSTAGPAHVAEARRMGAIRFWRTTDRDAVEVTKKVRYG